MKMRQNIFWLLLLLILASASAGGQIASGLLDEATDDGSNAGTVLNDAVTALYDPGFPDSGSALRAGKRPKVGLVLSGGGAKGIAHVGVLKVIEEAGLKIDFIGGTSMGSIVGGLYAIGYGADSLEKLVRTVDWNHLLSDEISRRDLSIEETPDDDLFFVSFGLRERSVKLPAGAITGQNIENQFAELCTHIYDIRDFNDFQIPYLCIGADVETGTEKVFHSGYLPACMRASMAIPSVFTPIKIDGRLYVDGGVINNFPVDRVREMGADIIIGVNVGYFPKASYDEMNMLQMIEHSVFMTASERTEENKSLCDIYIEPDMTGYSASSFSEGDSLISRGEMAALPQLERLRSLADSLNGLEFIPFEPPSFEAEESLLLREIRIEGIQNVSGRLVRGKLNLEVLERVSPERISEAIDQLYSTLFFEKVTYELEPMYDDLLGKGVRLVVKVVEKSGGQLRVGLNYSNNYKASIILNTTFRNLLLDGSKTSVTIALGENPYLIGRYEKNNGWKPGFVAEIGGRDMDLDLFDNGQRYAVWDYSDIFGRLFSQSIINNSYALGLGFEYERITLEQKVGIPENGDSRNHYYDGFAFINLDTWDNRFYPRRGTRFDALYKYILSPASAPDWFARASWAQAIPLGSKLVMIPRIYGGSTSADSNLQVYRFYLGGLNRSNIKGIMPFAGLEFMERSGRNVIAGGIDLQYNFWRSNYLAFRINAANMSENIEDILHFSDPFAGFGLTLGNLSIIGPVEITLMRPNFRNGLMLYINIGHFF